MNFKKVEDKPRKVTAYLKVTAEFYDPEATPETVRACVEQDLEDAGYEVEAFMVGQSKEETLSYFVDHFFPPNADTDKVWNMTQPEARAYLRRCWLRLWKKDYEPKG